jgi:YHS domain-containing protein
LVRSVVLLCLVWTGVFVPDLRAEPEPDQQSDGQQHEMQMAREGSGTSWQPDSTPMYEIHRQRGPWMFMVHENAFLQFLGESGDRGFSQVGSINWLMGMAERKTSRGRLQFRAMFSAEPWTIGSCGYPDLFATGELCKGGAIHDRQHPHDLFMELSATYDASLTRAIRWEAYGGPVGEPALGPTAYPHRVSAMPNPIAPIGHHWFDSTHVSFGVVTAGLFGSKWKAEGSVFNGREPDEDRTDFDFGALDSVSGRLWFLPTSTIALQVSAGRLKQAEASVDGAGRRDVDKMTATATYNRVAGQTVWASTMGWGRNSESDHATNAFLLESSFTLAERDAWFGRLEILGKTPEDLAVTSPADTFALTKIQGGYTRYTRTFWGFRPGLGVEGSIGFVPAELRPVYGPRANVGAGVFLTVRPAMMTAATQSGQTGGGMIMVQTAFDPAKLSCSPPIDPKTAASTTYQGRTYYFCSAAERNEFLTNPDMSLSMMPPRE